MFEKTSITNANRRLNYLAPVSPFYNHFFIFSLVKRLFESLDHPPISISKKSFIENFGKISTKTLILESFIQVHLQAF